MIDEAYLGCSDPNCSGETFFTIIYFNGKYVTLYCNECGARNLSLAVGDRILKLLERDYITEQLEGRSYE